MSLAPRPFTPSPRRSLSLEEATALAQSARADGLTLVTTNGCFDLFHAGHLQTLEGARSLGDLLLVLINGDASVRRFKGPDRPYLSAEERAALLLGLRAVDGVVIFDEDTPLPCLNALQPAVHVKGGSYLPERVAAEEAALRGWGGRLVCLPLLEGRSSTALLEHIWARRPAELGGPR